MGKSYLFISDLHLGSGPYSEETKKEDALLDIIKVQGENLKGLFILGDLFDYWFEYRRVIQKGYFRLFCCLKNLTQKGVPVYYIIGNHDFMHFDFFSEYLGVRLLEDPLDISLEGKRFFMAHGDGLSHNDVGYKIIKKIFRNKFIQGLYRLLHPDLGIALATRTSSRSREHTKDRHYGESDGMAEAAMKKLSEGYDLVIFGHSHQRKYQESGGGLYVNLGGWFNSSQYGLFQDGKFDIIDWK